MDERHLQYTNIGPPIIDEFKNRYVTTSFQPAPGHTNLDTYRIHWKLEGYYYVNPDGSHFFGNGRKEFHRWPDGRKGGREEVKLGDDGHWAVYEEESKPYYEEGVEGMERVRKRVKELKMGITRLRNSEKLMEWYRTAPPIVEAERDIENAESEESVLEHEPLGAGERLLKRLESKDENVKVKPEKEEEQLQAPKQNGDLDELERLLKKENDQKPNIAPRQADNAVSIKEEPKKDGGTARQPVPPSFRASEGFTPPPTRRHQAEPSIQPLTSKLGPLEGFRPPLVRARKVEIKTITRPMSPPTHNPQPKLKESLPTPYADPLAPKNNLKPLSQVRPQPQSPSETEEVISKSREATSRQLTIKNNTFPSWRASKSAAAGFEPKIKAEKEGAGGDYKGLGPRKRNNEEGPGDSESEESGTRQRMKTKHQHSDVEEFEHELEQMKTVRWARLELQKMGCTEEETRLWLQGRTPNSLHRLIDMMKQRKV